ncbi:MAG: 5-oxoprolinase subunit PxpA [Polaribacter sp.]|nr:5-oxoprolinase subunit PxpA [Polaribacter sp.]
MIVVDINCDVGEGIGNEAQLMPYISSCNIACGGHAGTINTIDATIQLAQQHTVKIGAHPSFPDAANFGRKILEISPNDLQKSIEEQLNLMNERLAVSGAKLHHVKAHGALYNLSAIDQVTANVLVKAIKNTTEEVFLYVPCNSVIEKIALQNNIKIIYEAFADRNYNDDLSLVSRSAENALIVDKTAAFKHVYAMVTDQKVTTVSGKEVPIKASTFCVHGDHPKAIELVKNVVQLLEEHHIKVY